MQIDSIYYKEKGNTFLCELCICSYIQKYDIDRHIHYKKCNMNKI